MSIGLFDAWALRSMYAGTLSRRDVVVLIRTMRAHRDAFDAGGEFPIPARRITRSWRLTTMYAMWRFSFEQPALFVFGGLCLLPAIPLFVWTLSRWVIRLIQHLQMGSA